MKKKTAPDVDLVNSPPHYNKGKIEVIDFILDQKLNFCCGNVVKYVCRSPHKGDHLQDLEKARWYLNTEILEVNPDDRYENSIDWLLSNLACLLETLRHDRLKHYVIKESDRSADDCTLDIDETLMAITDYVNKDRKRREEFEKGIAAHTFKGFDKELFSGLVPLKVEERDVKNETAHRKRNKRVLPKT